MGVFNGKKFAKIEDLRQEIERLKAETGNEDFMDWRASITEKALRRMAQGNCYGPMWAKEVLRLYEFPVR